MILDENWANKNIKFMYNRQQKSASIQRHVHYHYHYNIPSHPSLLDEKYSEQSTVAPTRRSFIVSPTKRSWKDHISPEINQMYEQISMNESIKDQKTQNHRAASYDNEIRGQWPIFQPQIEGQTKLSNSRRKLIENLSEYEQYLKKRSVSALYVPKISMANLYKQQITEQHGASNNLFILNEENNQLSNTNRKSLRSLDDVIKKRADSKIFYSQKNCESTTAKQSNSHMRQSDYLHSTKQLTQNEPSILYKLTAHSQIKQARPFEQQEKIQKLSCIQHSSPSSTEEKILNQLSEENHKLSPRFQKQENSKDQNLEYRYELVKEQCQFLREKFIEHIEKLHGIKF